MISHVVIFRTRKSGVADKILECAKKLEKISVVKFFHAGFPLPSERPVVDDFFTAAIVVGIEDEAALNAYAVDPIHLDFVENCVKKYEIKVQVFDIK